MIVKSQLLIDTYLSFLTDLSVEKGWQTSDDMYKFFMQTYDSTSGEFWLYVDVTEFEKYQDLLKSGRNRIQLEEWIIEVIRIERKKLIGLRIDFCVGLEDKAKHTYFI